MIGCAMQVREVKGKVYLELKFFFSGLISLKPFQSRFPDFPAHSTDVSTSALGAR